MEKKFIEQLKLTFSQLSQEGLYYLHPCNKNLILILWPKTVEIRGELMYLVNFLGL